MWWTITVSGGDGGLLCTYRIGYWHKNKNQPQTNFVFTVNELISYIYAKLFTPPFRSNFIIQYQKYGTLRPRSDFRGIHNKLYANVFELSKNNSYFLCKTYSSWKKLLNKNKNKNTKSVPPGCKKKKQPAIILII